MVKKGGQLNLLIILRYKTLYNEFLTDKYKLIFYQFK